MKHEWTDGPTLGSLEKRCVQCGTTYLPSAVLAELPNPGAYRGTTDAKVLMADCDAVATRTRAVYGALGNIICAFAALDAAAENEHVPQSVREEVYGALVGLMEPLRERIKRGRA